VKTATVPAELEGPLDRAVRALFGTSWGKARAWIAEGKVRVAGEVAAEPTARVRAGVEIAFEQRARRPRTETLSDEEIVYVDAQVVVVAKPPGVTTVPYEEEVARRGSEARGARSLDALVRDWLQKTRLAPRGGRPSLGVVHRLDKETSGLIVFTRTWLAKQHLGAQFRRHTVHRRYLAIAHGDVRARTMRTFLLADRGDGRRGSARGTASPEAREAITHIEVVERGVGAALVACRLETGRTHQIRIHLSEAGHPLVGERVYLRGYAGAIVAAPRLMLHAAELGFVHPATEQAVRWELPMPDDMRTVIERLRRR
jgi:23S rRNA pseudouridine1911/1915/1917 synthase